MDKIPNYIINHIESGNCVIYPTTTLPGLGCLPIASSLDKLFAIKERSENMPVSLAVSSLEQAENIVNIPPLAKELISEFPPASITIVLDARDEMDARLGGKRIAIRLVAHPLAKELISRTGPITATSANPSGQICPNTCEEAATLLKFPEDAVLSGICTGGLPSTLIRLSTDEEIAQGSHSVTIMREGILPSSRVIEWSTNLN